MKVKNRKVIRRLSYKTLLTSRKRNAIAILAIVLTTILFTSLFTIVMSINATYQNFQFRQVGGYAHGAFKAVNEEQIAAIKGHPKVRQTGERTLVGLINDGEFMRESAEVSYMDANDTKWSYALPTVGHLPEKENEVTMDTKALELLGAKAKLGEEITITYTICDKEQMGQKQTDTFVLAGYWEYDNLMPVHYINISEAYKDRIVQQAVAAGMEEFRTDLSVMLPSSANIEKNLQQIDTDLGYDWTTQYEENSVRIGVNWGYTSVQLLSGLDAQSVLSIIAFLLLVIFTGYLIIYNIFQISVARDIRFYGLLKTIGVTPRQLRQIIRDQAFFLCLVGVPLGLIFGYGIGAVLTPVVLKTSSFGEAVLTVSASPVIFLLSALFAVGTVFLSCALPGKKAARVSPIEATKYTQAGNLHKAKKKYRGAKLYQMAFANLGRQKSKTVLVLMSLAFSVVLLNILFSFIGGFDTEKYLQQMTAADFIVADAQYFHQSNAMDEFLTSDQLEEIRSHTKASLSGCGYVDLGLTRTWMKEDAWRKDAEYYLPSESVETKLQYARREGGHVEEDLQLEMLDRSLFDKLPVLEGDISPVLEADSHSIALVADLDDYGQIGDREYYPNIGDTLTVIYADDLQYVDGRTGELADENTPEQYLKEQLIGAKTVEYTVSALVDVPYGMSYRCYGIGYGAVLPVETYERDSGQKPQAMFYLFDSANETDEAQVESYLMNLTDGDFSTLSYESKETQRAHFNEFRQMFLLLGLALCVIIALVGILNFFNAIMTGILSRKKEFATLQAIGMTGRQLKWMLIYEGLFYALGSATLAVGLSLVLQSFLGKVLEKMFWFYSAHFTILPVILAVPVFAILGFLIPMILNGLANKQSVVERLREVE